MLTLTLMVPGLFQAPPVEGSSVDALGTLFARADVIPAPSGGGVERRLFALFGARSQQEELPLAAVTRLADTGRSDAGWWLRADPVHLQLERNRLVLLDNHRLGLIQAEADQLLSELVSLCPPGWRLESTHAARWYLQPTAPLAVCTTPLSAAVGRDVSTHLPTGDAAARLRAWLTELQMQLHASPVNATREARGELPVNSLWFWGGGTLPQLPSPAWTRIVATDPITLGLARLAGVPIAPLPATANDWLQQAVPGKHLLVLDRGYSALQYRDEVVWREFVKLFITDWIAPLLSMLKQKRLARMTLYSNTGPGLEMTRSHLRRWWRRSKRFAPTSTRERE